MSALSEPKLQIPAQSPPRIPPMKVFPKPQIKRLKLPPLKATAVLGQEKNAVSIVG